jgi:hypothetical protein
MNGGMYRANSPGGRDFPLHRRQWKDAAGTTSVSRKRSYERSYNPVAFVALLLLAEIALLSLTVVQGQGHALVSFGWLEFSFVLAGILVVDFFLIYYFSTWVSAS